ncbi:xanthine dehydrogenase family protein subunit M [Candidatus Sumerlaeota bacterium]|nr:xanthine dehydrogenase family protein subunit M [Candidatus Sumerlaeota bacterium]
MELPDFDVRIPDTLKEAAELLARSAPGGAMSLAGGTDLLIRMKEGVSKPGMIIILEKIGKIKVIKASKNRIRIGGAATFDAIIRSKIIQNKAPVLAAACEKIGSPQIRNRGTIGGNIANASPCADSVPALAVLEAEVALVSQSGERRLPVIECFKGPKKNAFRPDEIISHIEFPAPKQPLRSFYLAKGQRKALSITKLSVACQMEIDSGGKVKKARIAYGAVAPTVIRGYAVEEFLTGKALSPGVLKEAEEIARKEIKPIDDIRSTMEYRRIVTGALLRRGLSSVGKTEQ